MGTIGAMTALRPPSTAARVRDEQPLSRIAALQLPFFHCNLKTALSPPYRRENVGQLTANRSSPSQFRTVVKAEYSSQSFIPGVILRNYCQIEHYLATKNDIYLSPKQISAMKSTAFANLINMPLLQVDTSLLEDIIKMYRGDSTFEIAQGVNAVFKVEDVGRILGIPSSGIEIVPIKKSKLLDHVLRKIFGEESIGKRKRKLVDCEKEVNKKSQLELLNRNNLGKLWRELAIKNNDEDTVNMCRVWMLYLMSTFLIPTSKFYVSQFVCHYLYDVQLTTSMNWAKLVHTILLNNMETLQIQVRKKRIGQPYSPLLAATGCTMCLIVWILELTQIATPKFPDLRPRIKKWAAPMNMKMTLSDVDGGNVKTEIEYDKNDEWQEIKDQEPHYLASTGLKISAQNKQPSKVPVELKGKTIAVTQVNEEASEDNMLKRSKIVEEELVRHKQRTNATFVEKFGNLIDEKKPSKVRNMENEEASENMMKRLKFVEEEFARHKQKCNVAFIEIFCKLIEENESLKERNMELKNENKVLKEYFNQDLSEVIHEIAPGQHNMRYRISRNTQINHEFGNTFITDFKQGSGSDHL